MKRRNKDINPENGRFERAVNHLGRTLTLIKREQTAEAPWYLRMEHKGKPYWRSTDTGDGDLAVLRAKPLIQAILAQDERTLAETKLRDPLKYATLEQVFGIYRVQAPIRRRTIGSNISALRSMLKTVRGDDVNVEAVRTDQLTAKLVRDFQGKAIERVRAQKLPANEERNAMAGAQRGANSTWMQARSIFVQPMMAKYQDAGLHFPLKFETDFLKAPKVGGVDRTRYVQPADELIDRTMAAARAMMAAVERARRRQPMLDKKELSALDKQERMMVCFVLEIGCGLRKGEIITARGGWIGRVNGQLSATLPKEITKNGLTRRLRVPRKYQGFLLRYLKRQAIGPEAFLIPNAERIAKEVGRWLRGLGWDGRMTNHALRKYFGYLMAKTHGIEAAQWALDHKNIDTTQNSYTGILKAEDAEVTLPEPGKRARIGIFKAEDVDEKVVALPAAG